MRSNRAWRRDRPVEVPDQHAEHCSEQEGDDWKSAGPRLDPTADRLHVGPHEDDVGNDQGQHQSETDQRHEEDAKIHVRIGHLSVNTHIQRPMTNAKVAIPTKEMKAPAFMEHRT